ncbi:hypothetical protein [uncultured Sulfitobacter sp.]|uniref:hypothetical protein n=1 Tax=uncultured Sulfitobacter sp. TaxID=191468 RepID=UPI00262AC13C|nr:hypothetical protein [uncultured Sulfitobacter sp.]
MNPNELIIRFDTVHSQTEGPVTRLVGFVRARNLLPLLDASTLDANPRTAKVGQITADIRESIEISPSLFPFKTKGILVASANCTSLERRRYKMTFENPAIEGILDGGHNTLAIGLNILSVAGVEPRIVKKIKSWPDFKAAWDDHEDEIKALKKSTNSGDDGALDFLVPVEILIPSEPDDDLQLEAFTSSLFEICAARNNNRQLADEAKANKKGLYDHLITTLSKGVKNRVEQKTNDGGDIKIRDIVALSWIPLSLIDLPTGVPKPRAVDMYSGKGKCSSAYDTLMEHPDVSKKTADGTYELYNTKVAQALSIAGQMPELYDLIYREFPGAYNDGGNRFGRLNAVKMAADMRTKPVSAFNKIPVLHSYPEGFILPLVYGLSALLEVNDDNEVEWLVDDPAEFVSETLVSVVRRYRAIIEAFSGDPQKIGKNGGAYAIAKDAFETELLKLNQSS